MPPKTKSASHYASEIRAKYPEVQILEAYVQANPEDLATVKELKNKKAVLRRCRDCWTHSVQVTVYVDGREQLENTPEELGYQTKRTPQYDKNKWPYYSVGDYTAYIEGIGWYPVCRERKSLPDLDDTSRDKDHRKNLYDEYTRFLADDRFTIFRYDLECTPEELENYLSPMPKTCKFCEVKRVKTNYGDYYCPKNHNLISSDDIDFKCHDGFVEKKRDPVNIKAMKTLRKTIIRQCFEMGMQVVWRGSREAAYGAYRPGVEEWLKLNYVKLLKLDIQPYNDHAALLRKKAELEAGLEAVNCSLGMLEVQA